MLKSSTPTRKTSSDLLQQVECNSVLHEEATDSYPCPGARTRRRGQSNKAGKTDDEMRQATIQEIYHQVSLQLSVVLTAGIALVESAEDERVQQVPWSFAAVLSERCDAENGSRLPQAD